MVPDMKRVEKPLLLVDDSQPVGCEDIASGSPNNNILFCIHHITKTIQLCQHNIIDALGIKTKQKQDT